MRNAGLDELQAGIKIGGRNINNLRYVDDIILMAESEEDQKSLLMRVKEESERAGLRLNVKKKFNIMVSSPITARQIEGKKLEVVTDFSSWAPKSLGTVIVAMKSEDSSCLAGRQ